MGRGRLLGRYRRGHLVVYGVIEGLVLRLGMGSLLLALLEGIGRESNGLIERLSLHLKGALAWYREGMRYAIRLPKLTYRKRGEGRVCGILI